MSKYLWSKDDLMNRLNFLYQMVDNPQNKKKYSLISGDIAFLERELYSSGTVVPVDEIKLLELYRIAKKDISLLKFMIDDIDFFSSESYFFERFSFDKNISYSKEDIFALTHDFYKSLDNKFFYHYFYKNFKDRRSKVTFENFYPGYNGITYPIFSLGENYIKVFKKNNESDVTTLIHEYGHSITSLVNPNHLLGNCSLFYEVESLFFELVAADYLHKQTKNINFLIERINYYCLICDQAFNVLFLDTIIKEEKNTQPFTTNKELQMAATKYSNISSDEFYTFMKANYNETVTYLTSYLIAIELFMIYREEPDKALDILRRFIQKNKQSSEEYYSYLAQLGITPNNHLNEYQTLIKDDILKLKRTKKDR